jgi:hypothetical protein
MPFLEEAQLLRVIRKAIRIIAMNILDSTKNIREVFFIELP